jgi:hypothetical protein
MRRIMLLGAALLALSACQGGRGGYYGAGGYEYGYGPGFGHAQAEWNRHRPGGWHPGWDAPAGRSWAEERYRRTGYIHPADYGQPWVPREPRYGYGEP